MVSHQPEPLNNATQFARHAVPYTPPVQVEYGRRRESFYSTHPQGNDFESKLLLISILALLLILTFIVDDEFDLSTPSITHRKPLVYRYQDAPALETYPRGPPVQATLVPQASLKPAQPEDHKRKENPPTASAETTVVTKRIKVEGSGSRGRIRTADFDELTRSIIEETISIYRAQIGAVEPFPERTDDRDTVKQAWVEVCTGRNLRVELEEDIFKLVSQFRGFFMFHIGYSTCRWWVVLPRQEGMQKPHLGHTSCPRPNSTAMAQSARFGTALNNFWKEQGSFTRYPITRVNHTTTHILCIGSYVEDRHLSCPSDPDSYQQDLVQEQRGRRRHPP